MISLLTITAWGGKAAHATVNAAAKRVDQAESGEPDRYR